MVVEDQLDRRVRRIGGIEKPDEFDELSTAASIFVTRTVDHPGEQINLSQRSKRIMAFAFMIARERSEDTRFGRKSDAVVAIFPASHHRDDRHRLYPPLRLGKDFLQNRAFTIDAKTSAIFCSNSASQFSS
jgi:hypothetical protein